MIFVYYLCWRMLRLANIFLPALQRIFLSSLASLMNSVGNNVQQFVIAFPQFSLAANPLQRATNETHIAHSFCTVVLGGTTVG